MAQPYVGEIRMFAGNFAPNGWMFCDGQLLPISENEVLFQLIGTTYGGDGQSTFGLPDLRGRVPMHMGAANGGSNFVLADSGGVETVTLTTQAMPAHTHALAASDNPASAAFGAGTGVPGNTGGTPLYGLVGAHDAMHPLAIDSRGGSAAHDNMAPSTALSFIISLFGIFPSPT
jgi:microcystin-dependent protein